MTVREGLLAIALMLLAVYVRWLFLNYRKIHRIKTNHPELSNREIIQELERK